MQRIRRSRGFAVRNVMLRTFCSAKIANPNIQSLLSTYEKITSSCVKPAEKTAINLREVFANNHLGLSSINVIGFDYDYTLCHYTDALQHLIYKQAKDHLVETLRYPSDFISHCEYDPTFAIRGLTIDSYKGLLCKMSSHQKLAYNGVFRGRNRLSREEVLTEYNGSRHIPKDYRDEHMQPLNDLFSVAHACLFADVIQFFLDHNIPYAPRCVFEDIDSSIGYVHTSGQMHDTIRQDLATYIEPNNKIRTLLERMKGNDKELFVCTNSSFQYLDAGMEFMIGKDWRELFDVVMVSARKPDFYTRNRSFRLFDEKKRRVKWQPVNELKKEHVYSQGSLDQLLQIKNWKGSQVLYIGDSLFSDLVEPHRIHGWRTGAIIRDLEEEMNIQNTETYRELSFNIEAMEELMRRVQAELSRQPSKEDSELLETLVSQYEEMQFQRGKIVNSNFGSVFRVQSHPSQFAFSVQRYVDIYTSRLENLLDYPDYYTFYPQHTRLPHEPKPQHQSISQLYQMIE